MNTISQYLSEIKRDLGHVLNGRIEAAGRIAEAGKVVRFDDCTWIVGSERDPQQRYTVTFHLGWQCTCPDCQQTGSHPAPAVPFCGGVQPVCKHILAAAAVWVSGQNGWSIIPRTSLLPCEYIPFMGEPVTIEEWADDYAIPAY